MRDIEARVERDIGGPLPAIPAAKQERPGNSTFGELFKPPYLGRTVMMSAFNLLSVVGYYGFAAWVPTLLIDKGITVTTSLLYAFIIAIANPVGPLLGFLVADRMERKWQIVCSGVGIGVFMLLFALQSNQAVIIVLGIMVTLSNNWLSFTFHNYQAELFPTRVRARAVGFVYAWGRASAAFVGLLIGFFFSKGGTLGVATVHRHRHDLDDFGDRHFWAEDPQPAARGNLGVNGDDAMMVEAPDGVRLAVHEWGNPAGEALVLVHGFAQCHLCFAPQVHRAARATFASLPTIFAAMAAPTSRPSRRRIKAAKSGPGISRQC